MATIDRQKHLFAFVALHHHTQKRKYTNEPYLNHLIAVAEAAKDTCKFGYEIGLCHDLLEDTGCTIYELITALNRFGYEYADARFIAGAVSELTDAYTHEDFPQLNRAKRKALEAQRLHKVSYEAQTVKYCDLIDNTKSIVEHDKGFAVKYLEEKGAILKGMNKGNPEIYKKCRCSLANAKRKLNEIIHTKL